ncbi:Sec1 domain-containing protein 2 [Coemansia sp. RSA 1646]|nr:Sec1 domain-containing protein 2 [Coemansia sp. RSA 1646]KAJ1768688.1 hypothetical protein LPJ74_004651 [Coemansia sp. RSA 1843]
MFIVGSVAWPSAQGKIWPAVTNVLLSHAHTSCTFCSPADPALWPDVAACYPPDRRYFATQQLTRETVSSALSELLMAGCSKAGISLDEHPVSIVTLPAQTAMPFAKDVFVLPDSGAGLSVPLIIETHAGANKEHHSNKGRVSSDNEIRQQMECVSLNVASFLKGLRVRGRYYSFGEFSSRVSRRCMGLARNSSDTSETGPGSVEAIVVLLDRALDLVSPTHHNKCVLDQLYRSLLVPCSNSADTNKNDRMLVSENSLISLLRSCGGRSPDHLSSDSFGTPNELDMWETLLMNEKSVAMQMLRRKLIDKLRKAGGKPDELLSSNLGKDTADQVETLAEALTNTESTGRGSEQNEDALADIARGVVSVEATAKRERWSETEGAEKTLKLIIGGIKDTLQEATEQQSQHPFAGASLLGSGGSSRRGENAGDSISDEVLETEMEAAWDQVLAGIPNLTASMVESCKECNTSESFEKRVIGWLLKHTPAPGMVLMAASLLAPARCGVPQGQRVLAEQRLASDYIAVCNAMAAESSSRQERLSHEAMAEQWATRTMDMVGEVAVGRGQRSRATTLWRNIVGLSHGLDDIYTPLVGRIAADVLTGGACADLKHAEQGMGVAAAANLLKGIGRRFLSGASSAASGNAGEGALLSTGSSYQHQSQQSGGDGGGAGDVAANCNTVIFFVVGGITFEEAAAVTAAAHQFGGGRRVLVGGTGICDVSSVLLDV